MTDYLADVRKYDSGADEATGKITRKIEPARRRPAMHGGTADEACGHGLREERAGSHERHTGENQWKRFCYEQWQAHQIRCKTS